MKRTSTLAILLGLAFGAPVFAQRELTVEADLNGKTVLRTKYTDDGAQNAVDAWRYSLQKEPVADAEVLDFEADKENPKQAYLKGLIVLRLRDESGVLGEANLEELTLIRKDISSRRWYLSQEEVYRTAFKAGLSDLTLVEFYYKRLTDPFQFLNMFGSLSEKKFDGKSWLFILIPVLIVGGFFVVWMYVKDMRSIPWYAAILLALLRCTVYGLLAYMFLLPTQKVTRTWFPKTPPVLQKKSHVVIVLDVSESMSTVDDPKTLPQSQRRSRLQKVVDFLSDDNVSFLKKLLEKNPVHVYRFGDRLDKDNVVNFDMMKVKDKDGKEVVEPRPYFLKRKKDGTGLDEQVPLQRWSDQDWYDFANYTDFKTWVVKGLSEKASKIVEKDFPTGPGNLEWAQNYLGAGKESIMARLDMAKKIGGLEGENEAALYEANLTQLNNRINLARTIALGTNVTDSVQKAYDASKDNMLEAVIVFSDGRSNLGLPQKQETGKDTFVLSRQMEALHRTARNGNVLIFTVAIGDDRKVRNKAVRITDLQTLDRAPPDDAFKVIVEVDGDNMPGESIDVLLEVTPPDKDGAKVAPIFLEGRVTFDRGEPPHGQFEWTIDPATLGDPARIPPESRNDFYVGKEFREGGWQFRALTAKVKEDGTPDGKEKLFSDPAMVQIVKKPMRILVMCSAPNRDFQFLLNQLIRDKADVSVYVQNEAGRFLDGKSITYLDNKHRHLREFPTHLNLSLLDKNPDNFTESDWLNLAIYDAIVAFDPDWTLLTDSQCVELEKWVNLNAGGLLHVAGPLFTRKLTYPENAEKLRPLLEVFPVIPADYDLKMAARERKFPRRLEFPGATPAMEYLRLDDDKPDDAVSGWEPFFTGRQSAEEGGKFELKRGFFDYYPIKDVKAGATIVARYMEPNSADNTFDKKEPPYIVAYRHGQGWTAFMGSSEIWRFRQYKDAYFERFWVKMCRFLSSGNRKKQNRRGRILMAKEFQSGDVIRMTAQLLDAELKGLRVAPAPVNLMPLELEDYSGIDLFRKRGLLPAKPGTTPEDVAKEKEKFHQLLQRNYLLIPRKNETDPDAGYFEIDRGSDLFPAYLKKKVPLDLKKDGARKDNFFEMDLPAGVWRVTVPISAADEQFLSQKITIRKPLPPELNDVRPDLVSLAAIGSEVDELKVHLMSRKPPNPEMLEVMRAHTFKHPAIQGDRLAFHFNDRQTIDLIPDCLRTMTQDINNPVIEPEIRKSEIEPRWFNGPKLPRWATEWYDDWQGQSRRDHNIALWMLVCVGLLSVEWLTRKLMKLA
jgi:hypothetical protein